MDDGAAYSNGERCSQIIQTKKCCSAKHTYRLGGTLCVNTMALNEMNISILRAFEMNIWILVLKSSVHFEHRTARYCVKKTWISIQIQLDVFIWFRLHREFSIKIRMLFDFYFFASLTLSLYLFLSHELKHTDMPLHCIYTRTHIYGLQNKMKLIIFFPLQFILFLIDLIRIFIHSAIFSIPSIFISSINHKWINNKKKTIRLQQTLNTQYSSFHFLF